MPPAPAEPSDFYTKLATRLLDSRVEVRKKAQADWMQRLQDIMTLPPSSGAAADGTLAPTGGDKSQQLATAADVAVDDPYACVRLREALEWISAFLRSTTEKHRKFGVALLKDIVMQRPPKFPIADDVVKFMVDMQLAVLNDQSDEVRWAALDVLKSTLLSIRSAVYLFFCDILRRLINIVPQANSATPTQGGNSDRDFTRFDTAISDVTRNLLNVVHTQLSRLAGPSVPPFNMAGFIAVVKEGLASHSHNPAVCKYITQNVLKPLREMEHVHLLEHLHHYLGELLELLNANGGTPTQAQIALQDTLPLVTQAFLKHLEAQANGSVAGPRADRFQCMVAVLDVLQPKLGAPSAKVCLQWMTALLQHTQESDEIGLLPLLARMARCVVPIADAVRVNERVSSLLETFGSDPAHAGSIDFDDLLNFLRKTLAETAHRMRTLNWIALVHETNPGVCDVSIAGVNSDVLSCASDASEDVARKSFEVLGTLARREESRWGHFMQQWVDLVADPSRQLMSRVPMVVKQLQVQSRAAEFPCEFIMVTLSTLLAKHQDKFFVAQIVTTLSLMIVTAPELIDLRRQLKSGAEERCRVTFERLYACWSYSAVWAVGLCLLARKYFEAHCIVHYIAENDPSAHTLLQLDRLMQLLETPAFAFIRNALTMPRENPHLVRALYTVLMTLPQTSPQFHTLQTRLTNAANLQATLVATDAPSGAPRSMETTLFDAVFQPAQAVLARIEDALSRTHAPAS